MARCNGAEHVLLNEGARVASAIVRPCGVAEWGTESIIFFEYDEQAILVQPGVKAKRDEDVLKSQRMGTASRGGIGRLLGGHAHRRVAVLAV